MKTVAAPGWLAFLDFASACSRRPMSVCGTITAVVVAGIFGLVSGGGFVPDVHLAEGGPPPAQAGSTVPLAVWQEGVAALPLQRPSDAFNAPTIRLGESLHVNPGVAPAPATLPVVGEHGNVRVAYGRVADGVGARKLIEYLSAEAEETSGIRKPYRLRMTVRVVEGATPEMVDQTVRAVQWINAALPREHRLGFGDALVPREVAESFGTFKCEKLPCNRPPMTNGGIFVRFAPAEVWLGPEGAAKTPHVSGQGEFDGWVLRRATGEHRRSYWAGRVWVDQARATSESRLHVLVHEILHVLGRHHVDPERFPNSVMRPEYGPVKPVAILDPLDREVLLAVHGKLGPDAMLDEISRTLMSWKDASTHVVGQLDLKASHTTSDAISGPVDVRGELDAEGSVVAFGVGLRNGLARPWAAGSAPFAQAVESRSISGPSGKTTWTGRLLGFTPDGRPVAGAAALTVGSDTRDGVLRVKALESWPKGRAPGEVGTGAPLGNGEVSYRIHVRGTSFASTGGANGQVTAAFFGAAHQGMGGVVDSGEFTAGFGGQR